MSPPSPQNPGLTNWLLLITLGFIWGSAFMAVRISLDAFGPWTVAALRAALGAIILVGVGAAMNQSLRMVPSAKAWRASAFIGAIGLALPFSLLAWGQQFVSSAFAGVAIGAVPLLLIPLVYIFSPEEGVGAKRIIGMALGFVGLVILIGPGAQDSSGHPNEWLGRLACLGAAGCYACGSVVTRRAPPMPPVAFAAASLVVASLILAPIALLKEGLPTAIPVKSTLALLYTAAFPTALAGILRIRVITTAGSLFMTLVSYMVPVWSVILGLVILGEALPTQLYLALAVILAGIGLSQSRVLVSLFKKA